MCSTLIVYEPMNLFPNFFNFTSNILNLSFQSSGDEMNTSKLQLFLCYSHDNSFNFR